MLKFNVPGSARGTPGVAGMGGVLWNCIGEILCLISSPMGILDSNEAELLALRKVLFLFEASGLGISMELIVESDSKVALSWVEGSCSSLWKMCGLLMRLAH